MVSGFAHGGFYLTLATIGDFDMGFEQNVFALKGEAAPGFISQQQFWLLRTVLLVFVLISNVVMLNLFIGMMGNTYGNALESVADEFAIGQNDVFWNFDQSRFELPPPLNLIATSCAAPIACIFSEPPHRWNCMHCLGTNGRAPEPGKSTKRTLTCQV